VTEIPLSSRDDWARTGAAQSWLPAGRRWAHRSRFAARGNAVQHVHPVVEFSGPGRVRLFRRSARRAASGSRATVPPHVDCEPRGDGRSEPVRVGRHQGRTAWCLPARIAARRNGGDWVQGTCGRRFVKEGGDIMPRAFAHLPTFSKRGDLPSCRHSRLGLFIGGPSAKS
jgi:hypothetical protein